jgi:hypothetical protein
MLTTLSVLKQLDSPSIDSGENIIVFKAPSNVP